MEGSGNEEENAVAQALAKLSTLETAEDVVAELGHLTKEQLNAVHGGKTLLSVAVVTGRTGLLEPLLKLGCDPNQTFGGGLTALHLATKLTLVDMVQTLCEAGADPHLAADNGPSALSLALGQGAYRCYAVLAKHFIMAHNGPDRVHAVFEALRAPVAKGSVPFLRGLLPIMGADLPVTDRIICYCAREGTGEIMSVLLEHGGSPTAIETGQHDIPAVVLSAALGNASCLRALLSTDVKVDLEQECLGLTSLMHASREGHLECVQVLLDGGAQIDTPRSTTGWTALFFACNRSRNHVVKLLLERGANARHFDSSRQSALHVSTANRIIELLLRYGADPNVMDNELRTPLFRPVLLGDYMSIVHLLRFGADARLAHYAHLQRIKDSERRKAESAFVADPDSVVLPPKSDEDDDEIDPALWIPEDDRKNLLEEYKKEQDMGVGNRTRLDLVKDLLNHGMVWMPWKTSNHYLFPENVKRTIFTCLLCRCRPESPLSLLPRDVLLHICSFVATPSFAAWRSDSLADWDWKGEFTERCWEYDVSGMMSAKVKSCLDMGQCTKHLTGSDFLFQPFYKCITCKFGEEFGNQLGMCLACRNTCHKDHDTQIGGFLPAFCDCGESARCQLDSQWSLLANERDNIDVSKDGDDQYRFLISICDFHQPSIFRELRRPENLLHAVPGDIIRVERAKLEEPGLMCEGTLRSEEGVFPASRSYVLPMGEFLRALEDSQGRDANELKFKAGDLILPLGAWDGNDPEGVPVGSVSKGRVIQASGPMKEGWFSECAADLVLNYDIFRVEE